MIKLDFKNSTINERQIKKTANLKKLKKIHDQIHNMDCSEGTGWVDFVNIVENSDFVKIKNTAKFIEKNADIFLVVGVGVDTLATRSVLQVLKKERKTEIIFVGDSFDEDYILSVLEKCKNKDVCVNVISKSGNTPEVLATFHILEQFMKKKYKKQDEYKKRIFVTTDLTEGYLRKLVTEEDYDLFVIPKNISSRFNTLTSVGLLPFAVAGINIDKVIEGAKDSYTDNYRFDLRQNKAYLLALYKYVLMKKYDIEIVSTFDSYSRLFLEWYKQMFMQSCSKNKKGNFISEAKYTSDLYSCAQYIFEGSKKVLNTIFSFGIEQGSVDLLDFDKQNPLYMLEGKVLNDLKKRDFDLFLKNLKKSKVPFINIKIDKVDEYELGYLIYFIQLTTAVTAYLNNVEPFFDPVNEKLKNQFLDI